MATIIPFSEAEREAQRKAEKDKVILTVRMKKETHHTIQVALSYLALREAKDNSNFTYANELLDINREIIAGVVKE